ncbi:DNA-binding protein [bacterium]|nr:DNA-binding protein [bacterium]
MGQLLIRELEQSIIDALESRAAKHGRSTEAEHKAILEQALLQPNRRSFIDVLVDIPGVGNDSDFIRVQDQDAADERHVLD